MIRIVVRKAGGYDRLELEEAQDPEPGPGEVAIDVDHAGINYADCIVRMGLYASAKKYVGWPITPGFEVSGRVDGKPVIAVTRFGGYASRIVVPEHQVFLRPATMTSAEGAGFAVTGLTAAYALCELAHPRPGSRILVHSAAGGVGSNLVQIAKALDATVVGVVGGPHKVAIARACGCDEVIDKSSQPLWSTAKTLMPDGFDVVCDANGASTLRGSYKALAPAGKLVVFGFASLMPREGGRVDWARLVLGAARLPRYNPLTLVNDNKSILAFNLSFLFPRDDILAEGMERLLGWHAEGRLRAPTVTTYPYTDVAAAHRDLEAGFTVGKLVLAF